MSGTPAYHGWTHRPASEGGTDPIPVAAASDLIWALATASTVAVADSGNDYRFTFDSLYSNDADAFELSGVSGGRAPWVQLNQSGNYIYKAQIHKEGIFDNTNHTFIEPTYFDGATIADLQGSQGIADFIGVTPWNAASEVLAGGEAHESLYCELTFNYDPDNPISDLDSASPLKVGLSLALAGGASSISMSCSVWLLRIAAAGYVDLSPV